jgi:hypothetical protein
MAFEIFFGERLSSRESDYADNTDRGWKAAPTI